MKLITAAAVLLAVSPAEGASIDPSNTTVSSAGTASDLACHSYASGIDLPGNDIGSRQNADYHYCSQYCIENQNCMAWTWTNHQGGTCWLKGGYGSAVFKDGAYTGIKRSCVSSRSWMYVIVDNCDMRGNDAVKRPGYSYWECTDRIDFSYFDFDFTWSDYDGGTCWFKTSRAPCEYAPNKYTGVRLRG